MNENFPNWLKGLVGIGIIVPVVLLIALSRPADKPSEIVTPEPKVANQKLPHQSDNAFADFDKTARPDPKDVVAYFNRGTALLDQGQLDNAIANFDEAIRLDPKYGFAYSNRGNAWQAKSQYDKAISDYTEAIRIDPKHVLA
jgi:tetratricopeptide (TPR) repeat protein